MYDHEGQQLDMGEDTQEDAKRQLRFDRRRVTGKDTSERTLPECHVEHVHERRFDRHEFSEALKVHAVER